MSSTVVCTAAHPVDLDDGRSLPPGETAEGIDVNLPSNALLVESGQLTVVSGDKPHPPRKSAQAPKNNEEVNE